MYEEEQRLREEQHDISAKAEKRANDLNLEIEDIKAQLEQVCEGSYSLSSSSSASGINYFFCMSHQCSFKDLTALAMLKKLRLKRGSRSFRPLLQPCSQPRGNLNRL